jgi:uncharacterized protein
MNWIVSDPGGVILNLRVAPRASQNEVAEVVGQALKIRLQAPPVEGKANKALARFLAEALGVSASRIRILAGERGRNKRVRVEGLTAQQVAAALV